MAVVNKYGKGVKDPASIALPDPVFAEGRPRCITSGPLAVANGDSINSLVWFGKVASSAILLPNAILYHSAITGVTDFDIGIYRDGTLVDIDVLADGLNLTSAGSKSMVAALATGAIGKRLWEVLGLSSDPGCEYDVVGTFKAAASTTGTLEAFLWYAKK